MRTRLWLVAVILAVVWMCIGTSSANAILSVNAPAGITNGTSSVVTVSLNNDNNPPIGSIQFDLQFDPTVIQYVDYTSASIGFPHPNTGLANVIQGNKFRFIWTPADGLSTITPGSSELVAVTFKAISPVSSTPLDLSGIYITDITAASSVPVTTANVTFSILSVSGESVTSAATVATNNSAGSVSPAPTTTITPAAQTVVLTEPTGTILSPVTTEPVYPLQTTFITPAGSTGPSEHENGNLATAPTSAAASAQQGQGSILDAILDFFRNLVSWI
jgi:hypothetical protein